MSSYDVTAGVKIFLRGAIVEVRLDVAPDHEVWRLIRSIVSRLNPKVQRVDWIG